MKTAVHVVEVLKLMIRSSADVAVTDVARHLGLDRSTASRLMASLRDSGLVRQDSSSRRYSVGALALQLSGKARSSAEVLEWLGSELDVVARESGQTACLGMLEESDVVIMSTKRSGNPVHISFDIGARLPAHASALGKALLTMMPDEDIRRRFPAALPALCAGTITSVDRLVAEVATARRQGHASSADEIVDGISSVAVAFEAPSKLRVAVAVAFISQKNGEALRDTALASLAALKRRCAT